MKTPAPIVAAIIFGTLTAIAYIAAHRAQSRLEPVVYRSSYSLFKQCADLTGMCDIGV